MESAFVFSAPYLSFACLQLMVSSLKQIKVPILWMFDAITVLMLGMQHFCPTLHEIIIVFINFAKREFIRNLFCLIYFTIFKVLFGCNELI